MNTHKDGEANEIDQWFEKNSPKTRLLHVGCGSDYRHGWCNVDYYPYNGTDQHRGENITPDVWCDVRNVYCSEDSIDAIFSSHVIEHFYRQEACDLISNLTIFLKPGAIMIHEMPDLKRILLLYMLMPFRPSLKYVHSEARDVILSQLYGATWEDYRKQYVHHRYVWTRDEFCSKLETLGLRVLLKTGATTTHYPFRDMAIIAQKNGQPSIETEISNKAIIKQYGDRLRRIERQLSSLWKICKHGYLSRDK